MRGYTVTIYTILFYTRRTLMAFFTEEGKTIHFVGITGVGMVGLATLFHEMNGIVTGSDTDEEFFTRTILEELGIPVYTFDENNITEKIDEVIYSTAYPPTHPEIARAQDLGIRVRTYAEALAQFASEQKTIVVTGTHGKTTTAAMLADILIAAGKDPSALIGSMVTSWGRSARLGNGEWFVVEGDEYQGKFLEFEPASAIITNIDYDHPDFFPTEESYAEAFREFLGGINPGVPVVLREDDLRRINFYPSETAAALIPYRQEEIELSVLGKHNQANASAARTLANCFGIEDVVIDEALLLFAGTKRRLEYYTDPDAQLVMIDDYAHHPTEICASLQAVRERYTEKEITVIFQPHTFSRTEEFFVEFSKAFSDADKVIILEVYGSAREENKQDTINSTILVEEVKKHHADVRYTKNIEDAKILISDTQKGVVITMGAGDVWKILK